MGKTTNAWRTPELLEALKRAEGLLQRINLGGIRVSPEATAKCAREAEALLRTAIFMAGGK